MTASGVKHVRTNVSVLTNRSFLEMSVTISLALRVCVCASTYVLLSVTKMTMLQSLVTSFLKTLLLFDGHGFSANLCHTHSSHSF